MVTVGRPAGAKTCDDCRKEYAGPAYYTFVGSECTTTTTLASQRDGPETHRVAPHLDCTENLCPDCAGPHLEPDRPDDPRRLPCPGCGRETTYDDTRAGSHRPSIHRRPSS